MKIRLPSKSLKMATIFQDSHPETEASFSPCHCIGLEVNVRS